MEFFLTRLKFMASNNTSNFEVHVNLVGNFVDYAASIRDGIKY